MLPSPFAQWTWYIKNKSDATGWIFVACAQTQKGFENWGVLPFARKQDVAAIYGRSMEARLWWKTQLRQALLFVGKYSSWPKHLTKEKLFIQIRPANFRLVLEGRTK